jgi:hypothetical protein
MGTTTTPNLGLIKPDLLESIKPNGPMPGWAAQNALNMNAIDSAFHRDDDTWNPAWTGDVSNPSLGTGGFVQGRWFRVYRKMVIAWFRIYTGSSGFSAGSGTYRLDLPFTMAAAVDAIAAGLETPIGRAYLRDDSSVIGSEIASVCYAPDTNNLFLRTESGSWAPTAPFTITNEDRVTGYFIYPTDIAP